MPTPKVKKFNQSERHDPIASLCVQIVTAVLGAHGMRVRRAGRSRRHPDRTGHQPASGSADQVKPRVARKHASSGAPPDLRASVPLTPGIISISAPWLSVSTVRQSSS